MTQFYAIYLLPFLFISVSRLYYGTSSDIKVGCKNLILEEKMKHIYHKEDAEVVRIEGEAPRTLYTLVEPNTVGTAILRWDSKR